MKSKKRILLLISVAFIFGFILFFSKGNRMFKKIDLSEKQAALDKLSIYHDDVEDITWYIPSCYPEYSDIRCFALPCIVVAEDTPYLMFRCNYVGGKWIYFDKVVINIDGKKKWEIEFDYFSIKRQVSEKYKGSYAETAACFPSNKEIEILREIANSEKTIIRFKGEDSYYDLIITETDKTGIKEVLDAYEYVKG